MDGDNELRLVFQRSRLTVLFVYRRKLFGSWQTLLTREVSIGRLIAQLAVTSQDVAESMRSEFYKDFEFGIPQGWGLERIAPDHKEGSAGPLGRQRRKSASENGRESDCEQRADSEHRRSIGQTEDHFMGRAHS